MISMDYLFITRKGVFSEDEAGWADPDALKVLVAKDTRSKSVFAFAVPQKGIDQKRFAVDAIVESVLWLGYSRVIEWLPPCAADPKELLTILQHFFSKS